MIFVSRVCFTTPSLFGMRLIGPPLLFLGGEFFFAGRVPVPRWNLWRIWVCCGLHVFVGGSTNGGGARLTPPPLPRTFKPVGNRRPCPP